MTVLKELGTPVFKEEGIPEIYEPSYRLEFDFGEGNIRTFSMLDIFAMKQSTLDARLTSVSGFSVRAKWQGVLWRDMMESLGYKENFNFVLFESAGGYTTNVYRQDILPDRWMFCHSVDGERLEAEYGAPLRLIIPNLWGYKSCKWLVKVRFLEKNESGFWETHGYDDRGLIEAGTTLDVNTGKKRPMKGGEITEF